MQLSAVAKVWPRSLQERQGRRRAGSPHPRRRRTSPRTALTSATTGASMASASASVAARAVARRRTSRGLGVGREAGVHHAAPSGRGGGPPRRTPPGRRSVMSWETDDLSGSGPGGTAWPPSGEACVSSSWGGPGSISTWTPPASKAQPGAVPGGVVEDGAALRRAHACWSVVLRHGDMHGGSRKKRADDGLQNLRVVAPASGRRLSATMVCLVRSS